jgi:hypothetical protein
MRRIRDGNATGHDVADPTLWHDPSVLAIAGRRESPSTTATAD